MRAISVKSLSTVGGPFDMRRSAASEDGSGGFHRLEFDDFLMTSIKKFTCPISVLVRREYLIRDPSTIKSKRGEKPARFRRKSIVTPITHIPSPQTVPSEVSDAVDDHTLQVITYYDHFNQLAEIYMNNYHYQVIPRMLLQLITLKVPFTPHLVKFTIKHCKIDVYTIYELSKILLLTNITDVCLDHSPLKEGNYDILLANESRVRNLSLSRCKVNDEVCKLIAARLYHLEPAGSTLRCLNLSTNSITDEGIKHLGAALRSNRCLRYLNVADNQITDIGAKYIFDILKEFPLTFDEVVDQRKRYLDYLKKKDTIYKNCLEHISSRSEDNVTFSKKSKKHVTSNKGKPNMKRDKQRDSYTLDDLKRIKSENMAQQIIGPFRDPYSRSNVIVKDEISYSIGNMSLCYLNVAYNNLSFPSIYELLGILQHQRDYRNEHLSGLLCVVLEGNYMPADCDEYKAINKELLLARNNIKKGIYSCCNEKRNSSDSM